MTVTVTSFGALPGTGFSRTLWEGARHAQSAHVGNFGSMAVGAESFFSMADSLFMISSWARVVGVHGVVFSSLITFFKQSDTFLVYSGQQLAWKKASTVNSTLWVWKESLRVGSGEKDDMLRVSQVFMLSCIEILYKYCRKCKAGTENKPFSQVFPL